MSEAAQPAEPRLPAIEVAVSAGSWLPLADMRRLAEGAIGAAIAVAGVFFPEDTEISILFTDNAGIQALNAHWRKKDIPTNVLSFPQGAGPLLGDIVLAEETVRAEAALAQRPLNDHIAHLIVHGFFHLLGQDHEADEDAERMEELERRTLARIGIPDPYREPASDRWATN